MRIKKAKFEELKKETQEKTGISRQTFVTRLKDFQKNSIIAYEKPFYFLTASKSRVAYDKRKASEIRKIEERVDDLLAHSEMFSEGYNLLVRIFHVYYLPTMFDMFCRKRYFSSYEMLQYKNRNQWCEKLIKKIISTMYKRDSYFARNVINVVELELSI